MRAAGAAQTKADAETPSGFFSGAQQLQEEGFSPARVTVNEAE